MSHQEDVVEQVRKLLSQWEAGLLIAGEFECRIHDMFVEPFFKSMESGDTYMRFGSCCCSSHPPNKTFQVEIIIRPHGFIAKRLGEVVESGPESV